MIGNLIGDNYFVVGINQMSAKRLEGMLYDNWDSKSAPDEEIRFTSNSMLTNDPQIGDGMREIIANSWNSPV